MNNIFIAYQKNELYNFLITLQNTSWIDKKQLEEALLKKQTMEMERINNLIQFQLSTQFYESFCDFVVFSNGELYGQAVYGKDYSNQMYYELYSTRQMLNSCKYKFYI